MAKKFIDLVICKASAHLFLSLQGTIKGFLKAKMTNLESDSNKRLDQFSLCVISMVIMTLVSSATKATQTNVHGETSQTKSTMFPKYPTAGSHIWNPNRNVVRIAFDLVFNRRMLDNFFLSYEFQEDEWNIKTFQDVEFKQRIRSNFLGCIVIETLKMTTKRY